MLGSRSSREIKGVIGIQFNKSFIDYVFMLIVVKHCDYEAL